MGGETGWLSRNRRGCVGQVSGWGSGGLVWGVGFLGGVNKGAVGVGEWMEG